MKKAIKRIALFILFTILFAPNVFASEYSFYINNYGVEMTKVEYDKLVAQFGESFVSNLSKEFFDSVIENVDNVSIVDQKDIYIEISTIVDRNGQVVNSEQEITEEEYNDFEQMISYATCSGLACWETNAKKLSLTIYHDSRSNIYLFVLTNLWKSMPSVKSFDVIGFRWTSTGGGIQKDLYSGVQYYNNSNIPYSYQGDNSKSTSTGVGISMNIVDDTSSFLKNELYQYLSFTKKTVFNIFGTYQHATSAVTLSESKSYSFKSTGLGNVLYYSNSSIRGKYDAMKGITYSFEPKLYIDQTITI